MSEMFPETGPSPFGPDGMPAAMVDEGRRAHALELAVQLHSARARTRPSPLSSALDPDSDVIQTAERFADYLRGGGDG